MSETSYNEEYDLYVPSYEPRLLDKGWFAKTYRSMPRELAPSLKLCKSHRVCIQAGSCFGIYPNHLSQYFEKVYTFEPNPILFECTKKNADKDNVWAANYALGAEEGTVDFYQSKAGADTMVPNKSGKYKRYTVIQTTIDSMNLENVDMIALDIERYEKNALIGGRKTIDRCRPVIQVEMHEKSHEEISEYLKTIGYVFERKTGSRDEIYVPL